MTEFMPTESDSLPPISGRMLSLTALVYAFTIKLALFFPDAQGVLAAVWPPGGVALGVLLLAPRRQWRTILAVIFATGVTVNLLSGRPAIASVGFMVANALESWGCAWLMAWFCSGRRVTFGRTGDVVALGVCATVVNALTALLGTAVAVVASGAPFKAFLLTWWISDGLGILLVTPLIVVCVQSVAAHRPWPWPRFPEALALGFVWCACAWLGLFGTALKLPVEPRPYWIFAPLVWVALRFGIMGMAVLQVLLALIAVSLTVAGQGDFPLGGDTPAEHLQMAQLFLGTFSLTGMVLAAAVSERKRAVEVVRESEADHRTILLAALSGFWRTDMHGRILDVNPSYCRMSGYSEQELLRMRASDLDAEDTPDETLARIQRIKTQGSACFASRHRHKDGHAYDVEINVQYLDRDGGQAVFFVHDVTEQKQTELALRQSEAEHRHLVENSYDIIYTMTPTGVYTFVNQTWTRHLGHLTTQVVGHSFQQFVHPDDAPRCLAWLQEVLAKGKGPRDIELRVKHADGHWCWHVTNGIPLRDAAEKVIGFEGVARDITERKQAEDRERLAHDVLKRLNQTGGTSEMIADVLRVIEKQTGLAAVGIRLREGDDFPYRSQAGFSKEFLLTENTLVLRDTDGVACRDENGALRLECTCGLVLSGKTDPSKPFFTEGGSFWTNDSLPLLDIPADQEPRLNPRNRCIHDGFLSVALIPLQSGEEIIGLLQLNDRRTDRFTREMISFFEGLGASIGIALSRQREEDLLRDSENRFRALFDSMTEGVALHELVFDASGKPVDYRLLDTNPAFTVLTGLLREAVVGHLASEVYGGQPPYLETYADVANNGHPTQFETTYEPMEKAFMISVFSPAKGRFATVFADISERKLAEEEKAQLQHQLAQSQRMESVGRLAGGVAHDFNNLLMAIMGYAGLCRHEIAPTSPMREWLDEINKAGGRATALTRQLLTFARRQVIAPEVLDINGNIVALLNLLRRLIGENIVINWRPGAAVWLVKFDPSQLDQILTNLAVNARDAIAGVGSIDIETGNVTLTPTDCSGLGDATPGDYVLLTFNDTGCGMPQATLEHIFEPFFTTKKVDKGTGLGLATVYGIVKQSNGFINVRSAPGKGTSFRIYLPRVAAAKASSLAADETKAPKAQGNETILLVEDDHSVRTLVQALLVGLGYTVLTGSDPEDALRLVAAHAGEIHLLITDVIMPGMSGRDLAQRLAELRPGTKHLFISGFTADIIAQRGILDSGVNFLAKPFTRDQLACKVRKVLDT